MNQQIKTWLIVVFVSVVLTWIAALAALYYTDSFSELTVENQRRISELENEMMELREQLDKIGSPH